MNIVQVKLLEDPNQKRYNYKLPDDAVLHRGDLCSVKNRDGSKHAAVCFTDSANVSNNVIRMIMGEQRITSSVVGIYSLREFGAHNDADVADDDVVVAADALEI